MSTDPGNVGWRILDATPKPSRQHGVLVVDDDESMRSVLSIWLRHQGYSVWLAANGLEALELYQHHQRAISAVLMDVNMAIMDGPQTLVALRRINPHVYCCFMSASLTGYTEADLFALGASEVMRKPFRLMDISQLLKNLAAPGQRQAAYHEELRPDDGAQE